MNKDAQGRWKVGMSNTKLKMRVENLPEIADLPSPKFVFAHIYFAHDPFVFGPNGERVYREWAYTWRQVPGESRDESIKAYTMQVTYLNRKLDAALERLLEKSDKTPIILIQGDHGPSSRTNLASLAETDIHERYGILNAYLLPGGGEKRLYDSISPVNSFRVVFNHYFGTTYPLLDDKSYYNAFLHPYNYIPIAPRAFEKEPGSDSP